MTQDDMMARLRALLPPWFPDDDPVLDGLLSGIAALFVFILGLVAFAKLQTRVATAIGAFLDLAAFDYLGALFLRRAGEGDPSFQNRVRREILRPRNTRAAVSGALQDLTGTAPVLFEPWNPGDAAALGYTFGVGVGAPIGSLDLTNQVFITVKSPGYSGVPNVAGIGTGAGGIGVGALAVIGSQRSGGVSNAEIYATVLKNVAAGIRAWVKIT